MLFSQNRNHFVQISPPWNVQRKCWFLLGGMRNDSFTSKGQVQGKKSPCLESSKCFPSKTENELDSSYKPSVDHSRWSNKNCCSVICQIKDLKAMKKGTKKHTITEKKRAPLTWGRTPQKNRIQTKMSKSLSKKKAEISVLLKINWFQRLKKCKKNCFQTIKKSSITKKRQIQKRLAQKLWNR